MSFELLLLVPVGVILGLIVAWWRWRAGPGDSGEARAEQQDADAGGVPRQLRTPSDWRSARRFWRTSAASAASGAPRR